MVIVFILKLSIVDVAYVHLFPFVFAILSLSFDPAFQCILPPCFWTLCMIMDFIFCLDVFAELD